MLLPLVAAGFIYVNTTAINSDQLLALEPTKDNKGCLIHLITKNPFQVDEPCTAIYKRVEAAKTVDTDYTPVLAGAALGVVLGAGIGFAAASSRRRRA